MTDVVKLLNKDLDAETKYFLGSNIQIGVKAFLQFKTENIEFLKFPKNTLVLGHLLSYSVEKQLYTAVFNPEITLTAKIKKVNGYGCRTIEIVSPNFVFNIGKTRKKNALLNKSKYKEEAAKMKFGLVGEQLSLSLDNIVQNSFSISKRYAQITYGFDNTIEELKYANILIPNSGYTDSIYSLELITKEKNSLYAVNKKEEEMIVSLKKELKREFMGEAN